MPKLLKEKYKTLDNAQKRSRFENSLAKHEYDQGYKARMYQYTVTQDDDGAYRVARKETKGI
jgi:hypothetical protein